MIMCLYWYSIVSVKFQIGRPPREEVVVLGQHGYLPGTADMNAIFLAKGPSKYMAYCHFAAIWQWPKWTASPISNSDQNSRRFVTQFWLHFRDRKCAYFMWFFLVHGVPSLVQLMDWSLFGVKLLFEVMLTNCVKFYIVNGLQCNNVLQYFCKEQNVIYAVDDKPRDIPLSMIIYI